MSSKQYFFTILVLGALATISPFSIDMYLPGFPSIAKDLKTSIAQVELSLTSYLIGFSLGQLVYGPLLDRYGRKKPLYVGLVIYILASVGCSLTLSVESLIIMRFFQAMGGCVGIVASQALVRDLFDVKKTAQAFSMITLVIAVSPMIAPTVGGYVTPAFGWHWVFIILASITALILIGIYFLLPQGKHADATLSLKPTVVLTNFYTVIKQPQFLIYTLAGGLATAAPFAYIVGSSAVFMGKYGFNEREYGWLFAFLAFAMIASTQLNHILLKRFKSEQIIKVTLLYQSIAGAILVLGVAYNWVGLYSLIALMFIFLTGQGLTGPNATALSLAPFIKHAGSASALVGSWRLGAGGIISAFVSFFHNGTALPMICMMALCAWIGLAILFIGSRTILKTASRNDENKFSVL